MGLLALPTEALMIQLRPEIIVGEASVATRIVVPLVDNVLTLLCIDVGQYAGTGAGGT